ncbi:MAG: lamin tail domain-containing protein [Flavobacteriales bacterium]|nr:lamin tail domain-containing protein [Flavobacteriales bacterium]
MRFTLLFAALALGVGLPLQAQFSDDFSDGEFTTNPTWDGDAAVFTVNASQQLQLNNTVAATSQLRSSNPMVTLDDMEWRVRVKQTFAPSSSNFGRVYLVSDQTDLLGPLNGYYLQFGEAGSADAIELFEQTGTTSTTVCRGTDGQIAASFDVGVQVKRDPAGNWQLLVDPTGGTAYSLQASGTNNVHTASSTIGVLCTYTVSNANKFYYDDFYAGPTIVDDQPPTVVSVTAISATEVDVSFSEAVDATTAQTAGNYDIQPFNSATTAVVDGVNPALIHLTTASPLMNGNSYDLFVNAVQDLAGNAIQATGPFPFNYTVADEPEPGDVVINEIMADPTPVVQLPDAEFIELFNTTTDKFLDLAGWTFSDGGTPVTFPAYVLGPGQYVLVVSNTTSPLFATVTNKVALPSLPALNNGGDPLDLRDDGGVQIDAVTYALSWYGDATKENGGWTLERINPFAPCSDATNWIASNDERGGTPGELNSVFDDTPDMQAPTLLAVQVATATEIVLLFDERLDAASAATANYLIEPTIAISSVQLDPSGDRIRLVLATALLEGVTQTIVVEDIADCAGNVAALNGPIPFTLVIPSTPVPGDVVINEIMADPSPVVQLPDAEYLEVFNTTTDKYFDLTGWQLLTASTQAALPPILLGPGEYAVFVNNSQLPLFSGVPNVAGWTLSNTALLNGGTSLTLQAPGSVTIDAVTYSSGWYGDDVKDDGGWSLERKNPFLPCSNERNWTASNDERGGSPGAQNSVFTDVPDTQGPTLSSVQVAGPTEVVLVFSEGLDATTIADASYVFSPSLGILAVVPSGATNDRVRLVLASTLELGTIYTITVSGITDCSGNAMATGSASFALPEDVEPFDLVINEVLYDPVGTGSDFVELYNRSAKVLSLADLQLANESSGVVSNFRLITADPVIMLPGSYIVLATNASDIVTRYPQTHADRLLQMSLPSYSNGEGTVVLADAENNTIDLFRYSDDLHFTLLNTTEGTSLERVDPDRPTQENTNWHSAAQDIGKATPGFQNSQYAPAPAPTGELSIDPAIFSPDNDGYQDLLTIAYRFDQPGFVATLRVYDVAGREVRTLWNNELLGTSGAISWDGIMDSGSKARMGAYIVMLEAYDVSGNVEKFRKTVTLAHRLD